ncbi:lysophospholipid acyltransferase family protein [Clostridiisalibacter paucivorans]|uniref:lysophospholipid acyltransferase family protein n=1 Tax=Clostridiisalibacter paucivorans TaxID=408753 RepID=UPI00047A45C9|nr:lysophospholipid acyltransferase family protein [Clostridiisalibacter paucivorans]
MRFYNLARFLAKVVLKILYKVEIHGLENIPNKGKIVICSNHSSLWDPVIVATSISRQVSFMAKKELFNNKILKSIILKLGAFPVNRKGADLNAIKTSLRILKKGGALGIFPEGTRNIEGKRIDAKPGTAMIGIKSRTPIIPMRIITNYKFFNTIKVFIGKPIYLERYFGQKLSMDKYSEISNEIMNNIYGLGD